MPNLRDPVLVASFDGWVDAAEVASQAVAQIAGGGDVIATFDPDALFDYRSRRPILDVHNGRLSELRWLGYARQEVLGQSVEILIPQRLAGRH